MCIHWGYYSLTHPLTLTLTHPMLTYSQSGHDTFNRHATQVHHRNAETYTITSKNQRKVSWQRRWTKEKSVVSAIVSSGGRQSFGWLFPRSCANSYIHLVVPCIAESYRREQIEWTLSVDPRFRRTCLFILCHQVHGLVLFNLFRYSSTPTYLL